MKLLTHELRERLLANGRKNAERLADPTNEDGEAHDFWPVVKLFNPCGGGAWLLTELDPHDGDTAFGLCDLGVGCPSWAASASPSWRASAFSAAPWAFELDMHWKATKPLSAHADEAQRAGHIIA